MPNLSLSPSLSDNLSRVFSRSLLDLLCVSEYANTNDALHTTSESDGHDSLSLSIGSSVRDTDRDRTRP